LGRANPVRFRFGLNPKWKGGYGTLPLRRGKRKKASRDHRIVKLQGELRDRTKKGGSTRSRGTKEFLFPHCKGRLHLTTLATRGKFQICSSRKGSFIVQKTH